MSNFTNIVSASIVVYNNLFSEIESLIKVLQSVKIKTYIIDDQPSIESAKKKIMQVGEVLKEEQKAQEIIARIEKNVSKMQEVRKNQKFYFYFQEEKVQQWQLEQLQKLEL